MYSSGLRLSELVGITLADLKLSTKEVMVTDEGSKQRLLPITEQSVIAIKRWLKILPDFCVACEKLLFFLNVKTEYLCAVLGYNRKMWIKVSVTQPY